MFKYVWIIMLIILGLLLIGYTAWCIYNLYDYYVEYCERYEIPITAKFMVTHIFEDFSYDHTLLIGFWVGIVAIILITIFGASLVAYFPIAE